MIAFQLTDRDEIRETVWTARNYLQTVQAAVNSGDIELARELVAEALLNYPVDEALKAISNLIAPPKVVANRPASIKDWEANRVWLKANREKFAGKWVALQSGKLLGVSQTLVELQEKLGSLENLFVIPIH
jgi:hypothetical protein